MGEAMFENSVVLYGTQTCSSSFLRMVVFENSVVLYGIQTSFENE